MDTTAHSTQGYDDLVIADAVRSPLGVDGGTVAGIRPAVLLAQTGSALLARTLLEPAAVTRVVIAGGPRFDGVARDAAALMGVPRNALVPSPLPGTHRSVLHAAAELVGPQDVVLVVAASGPDRRTPSLAPRRLVHAERVAAHWGLRREELAAYAALSRERAREVAAMGEFAAEIVPAVAWSQHARIVVTADETLGDDTWCPSGRLPIDAAATRRHPELDRRLPPGTIAPPAAGAAATLLMREQRALELGLRPRARVLARAETADATAARELGPLWASRAVLDCAGLAPDDLDHYEVNESFASIPLVWRKELEADIRRFNPRGGALALGQPGPAAGLRSLATTLSALEATGGRLALHAAEGRANAGDALVLEYIPHACCSRDVLGHGLAAHVHDYRPRRSGSLEPALASGRETR